MRLLPAVMVIANRPDSRQRPEMLALALHHSFVFPLKSSGHTDSKAAVSGEGCLASHVGCFP